MSESATNESDRQRWDRRYRDTQPALVGNRMPIATFAALEEHFPRRGLCLEIACGQGRAAVWLARRGMAVRGVDLSPVAIAQARQLAVLNGVADRCHFEVRDLDDGLPETAEVALLLCHKFRDPRLYGAMIARLAPGGLLAIATLSSVGADPGRFRAPPGELRHAFAELEILGEGEQSGQAWLLGRKPAREAQ